MTPKEPKTIDMYRDVYIDLRDMATHEWWMEKQSWEVAYYPVKQVVDFFWFY
jgi:hypothetical protein